MCGTYCVHCQLYMAVHGLVMYIAIQEVSKQTRHPVQYVHCQLYMAVHGAALWRPVDSHSHKLTNDQLICINI